MSAEYHLVSQSGQEDQVTRFYHSTTARLDSVLPTAGNPDLSTAMVARYDRAGNQDTLSHAHLAAGEKNGAPQSNFIINNVKMVYDGLEHLRFLRERPVDHSPFIVNPIDDSTDAETRYDALGRRVWVQTRHMDPGNCFDHSQQCSVQRFLWDGSALVGEIRMPLDTAENDFAPVSSPVVVNRSITDPDTIQNYSWNWGAVAYLHAAADEGVDIPVAVIRSGGGQPWDLDSTHVSILFSSFPMYVHTDWRGKITAMSFDGGGPYFNGNVAASPPLPTEDNAGATPFGYRNAQRLANSWVGSLMVDQQDETGFQYRRNRYYDAATGRFTQEDPIGLAGGMNLYGFAGGDPVNFSDPFGLFECDKDHPADCKEPDRVLGAGCPAISDACNSAPLVPKSGKEALAKTAVFVGAAVLGAAIATGLDAAFATEAASSDVTATAHGAMRMADPARLGANGVRDAIANATRTYTQRDGAQVFAQQIEGRFNVVVQGDRGVITTFRNLSEKSLERLAQNYGWGPK